MDFENQWGPLWEDVTEIASCLYESVCQRIDCGINSDNRESHFLGPVVLKSNGHTPDLVNMWRVIDGQQRLTTIQLLMVAIIDESAVLGFNKFAGSLRLLTTNSVYQGEMPSKIIHRGQNYQQFSDVMVENGDANEIAELEGSIVECYRFFRNKVHVWAAKQNENIQYAAESLSVALLINFRVVTN